MRRFRVVSALRTFGFSAAKPPILDTLLSHKPLTNASCLSRADTRVPTVNWTPNRPSNQTFTPASF
jgi:hypothetical protein